MKKLAAIIASLLFAAPVLAQSVGEKSGVNSAMGVSPSTADFVNQAAISDMFEIQSSQLAAQRANEPTKAFASQMITAHQKTSNELKSVVQSESRTRAFHQTLTALTRKCWTSSRA
jgi:putative membrane protein